MSDEKQTENGSSNDNAAESVTEETKNLTVADDKDDGKQENGYDSKPSEGTLSSNEEKKIFVGGISADTSNEDLLSHFSQFGPVSAAQVKYDRVTGRSRGFAFVEFADADPCRKALASREQSIKGKTIEVKPAKSRENKKVFVGGLPADFAEEKLRAHFEKFGHVEDIEWPFDRQRNVRRNFAFIVFETEDAADAASVDLKQTFGERECDVKKAVPQSRRINPMVGMAAGYGGAYGPPMGAYGQGYGNMGRGGYFGAGRGRGGGGMGGFNAYGYGAQGWSGAANNAAAWNDWYGGQAATGGYAGGYGYGAGAYGAGYGGAYGAGAQAAPGAATGSDYWTSAAAAAAGAQTGGDTWGGTFNTYNTQQQATAGAPAGANRAAPTRPYQVSGYALQAMSGSLESYNEKQITVITGDGRIIVGLLKGFDQTVNLILNDAHERVYSANSGVELVPLGLYIIRGDNVGMIGEMDIDLDQRLDFANIKAPPLGPIWTQ